MTLRHRDIKFGTRFSMWVSKDKFGRFIIKACKVIAPMFGCTVSVRARKPLPGKHYGHGGSLAQRDAQFLSIYFNHPKEWWVEYWRTHEYKMIDGKLRIVKKTDDMESLL